MFGMGVVVELILGEGRHTSYLWAGPSYASNGHRFMLLLSLLASFIPALQHLPQTLFTQRSLIYNINVISKIDNALSKLKVRIILINIGCNRTYIFMVIC
jgi:hypothetical protein